MPLPRGLARLNRALLNKATRPFARVLPGFGILRHIGRASGEVYETPLNVWRDRDRVVVALTYGADVDWLANTVASGAAEMVVRGRPMRLGAPRVVGAEEGMASVPAPVRPVLRALGVEEFVTFPML